MEIKDRVGQLNWNVLCEELDAQGFTLIHHLLTLGECKALIGEYDHPDRYRKG